MKKKVIILGSTGSIGSKTFNIFKKDNNNFDILLLSTYSNVDKIVKQAKELKVKNIIINNIQKYKKAKIKYAKQKFKIFNNFSDIKNIIGKKKNILFYGFGIRIRWIRTHTDFIKIFKKFSNCK